MHRSTAPSTSFHLAPFLIFPFLPAYSAHRKALPFAPHLRRRSGGGGLHNEVQVATALTPALGRVVRPTVMHLAAAQSISATATTATNPHHHRCRRHDYSTGAAESSLYSPNIHVHVFASSPACKTPSPGRRQACCNYWHSCGRQVPPPSRTKALMDPNKVPAATSNPTHGPPPSAPFVRLHGVAPPGCHLGARAGSGHALSGRPSAPGSAHSSWSGRAECNKRETGIPDESA